MEGIIIALEGLDGSGKTIQSLKLANTLLQLDYPAKLYKEPSDTFTGRYLRQYLSLAHRSVPAAEAGLFLAAHAELMDQYVLKDLEDGAIVVMDRFIPSCIAYQCHIHGVPQDHIIPLYEFANRREIVYETLLLDISPDESVRRTSSDDADSPHHYDHAPVEQRTTVRNGYHQQAADNADHWHVIDGHRTIPEVSDDILAVALDLITTHGYEHRYAR